MLSVYAVAEVKTVMFVIAVRNQLSENVGEAKRTRFRYSLTSPRPFQAFQP